MIELAASDIVRFWAKVDRDGPVPEHRPELGPCWVWTASKLPKGYGLFRVARRLPHAHRLSWEMTHGESPGERIVRHECDNPSCVNPAHLSIGTHKQNMADMVARGRAATGDRSGTRRFPERRPRGERNGRHTHPERTARGEAAGMARLTEADVIELRDRVRAGASMASEARRLSVAPKTIRFAVLGRTWRHVSGGTS